MKMKLVCLWLERKMGIFLKNTNFAWETHRTIRLHHVLFVLIERYSKNKISFPDEE